MLAKRLSVVGVLGVVAAAVLALPATSGQAPTSKSPNGIYIVQMSDPPAVAYTGGIAGLKATKPAPGSKIDPLAPDTVRYVGYLKAQHDLALGKVAGAKVYDYVTSYNGFAARLSDAQAAAVAKQAGVIDVTPDEIQTVDTSSTPAFLGLDQPGGLWEQLGGPTGDKKLGGAGEGIVIGDIDSGIWPDSKSFSDRDAAGKLLFQQIPGWHGKCTPGERFVASDCNEKLIGAQWFNASWGGDAGIEAQRPWEFASARDYNGHGTHTASTAGGDFGVAATGAAAAFGSVSGMAPRARIAAYKALWSTEDASTASGSTSDLVAAIDQAVSDGVDVINYSISGTLTNFADPAEIAFLYAANAGVFVSASAGNSGPTSGTVAHPSPWITTVAAGTHNRDGQGSVTLGNALTYSGASVATPVGPAPLIDSANAGLPGADPTKLALCYSKNDNGGTAVLDPAKIAGKIVVCNRGVTARVNKSLAVMEGGGVGMILLNATPSSLNADFHFVPTVHLQSTDAAAVHAYAGTVGATATINAATIVYNAAAPFTASFSSRGPLTAGGGDLLKPDVIAPGQDILAAVAPPGNAGRDFNLYSGTSMSAPHVAGLAALLLQKHPDWTPTMVKSALMTSASDVLDGSNTNAAVIFRQGAGHVRPNGAADPGLVYSSGWNDWLAFLCGTTSAVRPATCSALAGLGYSLDASDLNVPSIAIGDLAGVQTVTRKVTNVGDGPATYTAAVTGLSGITTTVTPGTLTLSPGQTGTFTVKLTRTTATLNAYAGGQLTWSDGTHSVRIPLVVRPVALAAPRQVSGSYAVTFGYDGPFGVAARGLVPATTFGGSVSTDPDGTFAPVVGADVVSFPVTIPAGTTYARFSLFDGATAPASDLDLYVYNGATRVGSSGGGTSDEEVNLLNPAAGTYTVYVHGFATGNPSTFTLFTWALGSTAAGNMTATAPAAATTGGTGNVTLAFSGLTPGTKYLGSIAYSGVAGLPNPTIVRVDQ